MKIGNFLQKPVRIETIHKVRTLNFGDFQTPPSPVVHFETTEWRRHKNNRRTLGPLTPFEGKYFIMDGPIQDFLYTRGPLT